MQFKSIILLISAIQNISVLSTPVPAKSSSVKIHVTGKNNGGIQLLNNADGSQSVLTAAPATGTGKNKVNIKVAGKGNAGIQLINNGGGSQSVAGFSTAAGPGSQAVVLANKPDRVTMNIRVAGKGNGGIRMVNNPPPLPETPSTPSPGGWVNYF